MRPHIQLINLMACIYHGTLQGLPLWVLYQDP